MHTAHYRVEHLDFEHTILGLGRQLAQCPGVAHVNIDRAAGLVAIDYDDRALSSSCLERTIRDCGYDCEAADATACEKSA